MYQSVLVWYWCGTGVALMWWGIILTSGFFLLLNEFLKVLTKFDEVAVGIVDDTARFFTREAA